MARYKFVAFCNAADGKDEEFNNWYDSHHMPDMCDIPGFVSGERFSSVGGNIPFKYMAVYEVETDDLGATMGEIRNRIGTDRMILSDALDRDGSQTGIWTAYKA